MACKCQCPADNHKEENKDLLKSVNLKNTKKRSLLINCLRHSERPLSAEEIYLILRDQTDINLSTVYRILNAFLDAKIVLKQVLTDGNSVFQLNNEDHKHILTCKVCSKTTYINICPIGDLIDDIEDLTGYEITNHNLEIVGICPDCLKKEKKSGK